MNNVLIVVTSCNSGGKHQQPCGIWLDHLAIPYYIFRSAGIGITFASPTGGAAPFDLSSVQAPRVSATGLRFYKDCEARSALADTLKLSQVYPLDFQAVFYAGGAGVLWDLVDSTASQNLLKYVCQQRIPLALLGHGPAALLKVKYQKNKSIVTGHAVTSLSLAEETSLFGRGRLPFQLQQQLISQGAIYHSTAAGSACVAANEHYITGQNTSSAPLLCQSLMQRMGYQC